MRVLFLCTGNYFRSRFSQALLQQLIEINQATGGLQVDSAGLKVDPSSGNVGPMAPEAISALQNRGVTIDPGSLSAPKQVTEADLDAADVVVALDDASIKYSTVQNWYAGDEDGVGGIYNFVTKRGQCRGARRPSASAAEPVKVVPETGVAHGCSIAALQGRIPRRQQ